MEIVAYHQWQGAFKAAKTKRRQKKNNDQQSNLGLRQGVHPLIEMRPMCDGLGTGLAAFHQDEQGQQEIGCAKARRNPSGTGAAHIFQAETADGWTENESKP